MGGPGRTLDRENTWFCGPGRTLDHENTWFCGPGRTLDLENLRFCGSGRAWSFKSGHFSTSRGASRFRVGFLNEPVLSLGARTEPPMWTLGFFQNFLMNWKLFKILKIFFSFNFHWNLFIVNCMIIFFQ